VERIMERKILNLEQHVEFLYNELENKEKEIDELKKSLSDANDSYRRISGSRKDDLDDILEFKKVVKEQTEKIFCLRKHRDEILDRHEKSIDDYESEFKAKEDDIKNLQDISKQQKRELNDQKEELSAKNLELKELRSTLFNFEEKCSISLSEELKTANLEMEKDGLENENKDLRLQVEKLEKARKERSLQYLKMEEISSRMQKDFQNLKSIREFSFYVCFKFFISN
jgi:DNA repair exonuclease SbcCD ATPase subunit